MCAADNIYLLCLHSIAHHKLFCTAEAHSEIICQSEREEEEKFHEKYE